MKTTSARSTEGGAGELCRTHRSLPYVLAFSDDSIAEWRTAVGTAVFTYQKAVSKPLSNIKPRRRCFGR